MGVKYRAPIWVIIITGILCIPGVILMNSDKGFLFFGLAALWLFIIYPIGTILFNKENQ
jgi:hypothetical protein